MKIIGTRQLLASKKARPKQIDALVAKMAEDCRMNGGAGADQLQAMLKALQDELSDIIYLLNQPIFCPAQWASDFSPVAPPPALEHAQAAPEECRQPGRKTPRTTAPASKLEGQLKHLRKKKALSWPALRQAMLNGYGLKTLGEVYSVLRCEYGKASEEALMQALPAIFSKYGHGAHFRSLVAEWREAGILPPAKPAPRPSQPVLLEETAPEDASPCARDASISPPHPTTKFEKFLLTLEQDQALTNWFAVGDRVGKRYNVSNVRDLAQCVLDEYALKPNQIEHLRWHLGQFAQQFYFDASSGEKGRAASSWQVLDFVYYFFMRLWVLGGKQDNPRDSEGNRYNTEMPRSPKRIGYQYGDE